MERQKIRRQQHEKKIKEIIEEQQRKKEKMEEEMKRQKEMQIAQKKAQEEREREQRKQWQAQEKEAMLRRMEEQAIEEKEREILQKKQNQKKQAERAKEHEKWLDDMNRKTSLLFSSPSPSSSTSSSSSSPSSAAKKVAPKAAVVGAAVADKYKVCTDLVKEMKVFFEETFQEKDSERILADKVFDSFVKWRSNNNDRGNDKKKVSSLEKKLFLQHVNRLFLAQFLSARLAIIDNNNKPTKYYVNVEFLHKAGTKDEEDTFSEDEDDDKKH